MKKRLIIGALIGASVVPAIWLIALVVSLLFGMDIQEAAVFATMEFGLTFMGVFFAKMSA